MKSKNECDEKVRLLREAMHESLKMAKKNYKDLKYFMIRAIKNYKNPYADYVHGRKKDDFPGGPRTGFHRHSYELIENMRKELLEKIEGYGRKT